MFYEYIPNYRFQTYFINTIDFSYFQIIVRFKVNKQIRFLIISFRWYLIIFIYVCKMLRVTTELMNEIE